ncbi:N-acetylmuramoyl-L-alanine amidase LytC precursor [Desulfosporosinus acididurans]|uniref:N-acetylmuramoyl-L-alanine amidase LytC n=1 Tax=Desulfosporosinus acididurans TaxID=476652 RepID=A0A0J1FLE6_9FIRM|nr:cell wall-binding repeat-containing protein [Desulfosporosinus acididurans]KLU64300.1 N-acetylmuramoyl-L-alanine amidase LytC precursor [Desulfosporosinus acididurans]
MSLWKRNSRLCLILSLITLISFVFPAATLANSSPTITRLAGVDRYETASQIAVSGWSQSNYAVLAFGGDYPDALSAAPLAKKFDAPILLTDTGSLPTTTKQTLLDLHVKNVKIIGGTAVISQAVESELQTMGLQTTRIYGIDRYATAIQVAQQVSPNPSTLFVVTGEDYPDALSVGSIASLKQSPIILVPHDVIPDVVKNYIATLNISKTYIVGSSDIISDQVAQQFPNAERIPGADKYARNIAVNQLFNTDFKSDSVCLATGEGFADALTGTAFCAKLSEPLVLINTDSPTNTRSYYEQRFTKASKVYVFGGTGIIPESVITDLNSFSSANTSGQETLKLSDFTKVGTTTATFKYQVLDQTGKDITSTVPATQLSAVASVKSSISLDPSKGIGTITYNSSSDVDKPITITLVDLNTGRVVSYDSSSADAAANGNTIIGNRRTLSLSNFSKTGATTATFKFQVLDENGKDITSTVPAAQLSAVASVSSSITLDPSKGLGTITYNSSSDTNKPIITLVDLITGRVVSLDTSSSTGPSSSPAPANNSTSGNPSPSQYSDQKVSKITINSTKLATTPADGNNTVGYATYIVTDQYGADITNTYLANNIQFTSNVGTITARNGLIQLRFFSNINPLSLTNVTITGVDSNSNVTTTATLSL